MMTPRPLGIKPWLVSLLAATSGAAAQGEHGPLQLSSEGASVSLGVVGAQDEGPSGEFVAPMPYGAEGTEWILFGGGAAYDLQESTDLNLNVGYSRFLVDDVEWVLELGAWYHAQEGDDAASLNPVMEFRWHFYNEGDTSVFLNAGIGLLAATDNVPFDGTGLDFTPRAGVGLTHRLGEGPTRLVAGLRWHHISNARLNGNERNPSRDAPMLYVQFAVPF